MVNPERLVISKRPVIIIVLASGIMTHFLPYMSNTRNFRTVLAGVALVVVFLLMVWARVFYGSMQACREGEIYLQKTEYIKAITFFDRSIHWYTPFNPYVHKSAEYLWKISMDAQTRGDIRLALISARTIRRGFVSARSFYLPGRDWIEKCDLRIYDLLRIESKRKGALKEGEIAQTSVLENPQVKGPDPLWSIILLAGLLGWIGSAIGFIMSGFRTSQENKDLNVSKLKWVALWAVCFSIWIVGMIMA